ncbi:MAG TPA: relaxase/mobilization nuclease domain-containing protein [Gemmatimonadaceae bacterium]|nr:relaxase/mobilization nuclease domain-containing protein [Gemmatimonadaceae bacterium]
MIIKGGSRTYWRNFADYLMTAKDNERVSLVEIRGLAAETVLEGFRELDLLGRGTRSRKFYYHASINPREGEELTPEQWEEAVDRLEENLGLAGQPRMRVRHDKDGRAPHEHVVWSRVDTDTMTVIPDSHNFDIHMRTADALEKAFAHQRTQRGRGREGRSPEDWEHPRGQESGIEPRDVSRELTGLWQRADSGQAFAAAIEEHGYILAKGDRRDFVVVDPAGDDHSLSRRIEGATASEIRKRMVDVDRAALPTVAAARAMARDRAGESTDGRTPAAAPDPGHAAKPEQVLATPSPPEITERAAEPPSAVKAEPEPSPPAVEPPSPAPAPAKAEPSLFERLARKLAEAVHGFEGGPTAAESLETREHAAPAGPEASAFERAAAVLINDARKPAPAVETPPAGRTAVEYPGSREPELSPFDRLAEERFAAVRSAKGDGRFLAEGFAWRAEQGHAPPLPQTPPKGELSAFERTTWEKFAATRDNGGQTVTGDGHSFWDRAIELIAEARDRAREWAKGFVDRVLEERRTSRDDNERER